MRLLSQAPGRNCAVKLMRWRWIAGIVCALYLSVGVLAATHHHNGDGLHGDQQCAACAWHHEAVDVPAVGPRVCVPEGVLSPSQGALLFCSHVTLGIHPSRGPPYFL
jgi:hypothetical protein